MALSPRFQLDDILGNEVVDFAVLQANNDKLDVAAANQGLANVFTNVQTVHRAAVGNPALQVRLTADGTPRLTITADGALNWAASSLAVNAGVMTIGGTTLRAPAIQAGAGAAATPSLGFSTDPDTGLFSASADILGIAVGGVETNRINNQGEIRFNRTNARIAAYGSDDASTPGERLVLINALTVTPGMLYAAKLTVNGAATLSGGVTISGGLTASSIYSPGVIRTDDALNAYGGRINFESSNVVFIQWRGDLGALYIPYGNGIYTTSGVFTGNLNVSGTAAIGTRLAVGGYDAGWTANFASNAITAGRFYQQNNAGAYCIDITDCSVSYNAANKMVQRDGAAGIQVSGLYMPTGAQAGKPSHVLGQSGDGNARWWPASAVGPPLAPIIISQAWGNHASNDRQQVGAFQVDRNGRWLIVLIGRVTGGGGVAQYWLNIDGLGDVAFGDADSSSDSTMYASIGLQYIYTSILGPGNWIRTMVARADNNVTGTTYAYFIPTTAYNA